MKLWIGCRRQLVSWITPEDYTYYLQGNEISIDIGNLEELRILRDKIISTIAMAE